MTVFIFKHLKYSFLITCIKNIYFIYFKNIVYKSRISVKFQIYKISKFCLYLLIHFKPYNEQKVDNNYYTCLFVIEITLLTHVTVNTNW